MLDGIGHDKHTVVPGASEIFRMETLHCVYCMSKTPNHLGKTSKLTS